MSYFEPPSKQEWLGFTIVTAIVIAWFVLCTTPAKSEEASIAVTVVIKRCIDLDYEEVQEQCTYYNNYCEFTAEL